MTELSSLMIGDSLAMQELRSTIRQIAPTNLSVLIEGPTGAGKELVARALHHESGRRGQLVAFNACAVSESMFEDALFGHVRGAFTGAVSDSPGFLAEGDGGTVFFDEIGGVPLHLQAKLLRAIELREFRPVGGRHNTRSEFRVVTAMNESLARLVREGRFRADLAYRLSGVVLRIPPLAERPADVPSLVKHFLRLASGQASPVVLSEGALSLLEQQPWRGNVRELRQTVERALAFATSSILSRADVARALSSRWDSEQPEVDDFARRRLIEVLERSDWDTARAARELGIHRATLYRRLQRAGLPKRRGPLRESTDAHGRSAYG